MNRIQRKEVELINGLGRQWREARSIVTLEHDEERSGLMDYLYETAERDALYPSLLAKARDIAIQHNLFYVVLSHEDTESINQEDLNHGYF